VGVLPAATSYRSLLMPQLLEQASVRFASAQIVSADGDAVHWSTFRDLHHRAARLAGALTAIGVRPGDRVASIAWNDHRHIELYFAVTGLGAALHAIDPHLDTAAIRAAMLAAGDRFVCFDARDNAQYERIVALRQQAVGMIAMTGAQPASRRALDYERLLAEHEHGCRWAAIDENTVASLAAPRGEPQRLFSATHRTTALQAVAIRDDDVIALDERDTVLLVVPLFLPGTWSLACATAIGGANLVLPGASMSTSQLFELLCDEHVTVAFAPSNVWAALLDFMDAAQLEPTHLFPLRRAIACGETLHPSMRTRLVHAFGPDVVSTWSPPPDEGGFPGSAPGDDPT